MEKELFFCENNISKGLDEVIDKLEFQYPDLTIYKEPCLGYCGECAEIFYTVIDAEMITADTPEELYLKIIDNIEER